MHFQLNAPLKPKGIVRKFMRNPAFTGLMLLAFIFIRAIVPAGFMPNDGSSSGFYIFCYSAKGAAQLDALTDHSHEHHHAAHSSAQSSPAHHDHQDNNNSLCDYAAFSANIALGIIILFAIFWPCRQRATAHTRHLLYALPTYVLPAVRAPPYIFLA